MDTSTFNKQEAHQVCITDFDLQYRHFGSCNTPLSDLARVYLRVAKGNKFEILWRLNTHATVQELLLPDDYWAIQLPDPHCDNLNCYKNLCEGEHCSFVATPGQTVHWQISGNCSTIIMLIHHEYIEQSLTESDILWLKKHSSTIKRRALDDAPLIALSRFVLQQGRLLVSAPLAATDEKLAGDIIIELLGALRQAHISNAKANNRERVIDHSLAYIHHNYASALRLEQIASFACTTTRNLQLIFKTQFNLTPLQYIKRYRLAKFHQRLTRGSSVTDAAIGSGLRHMGRVSDGYRSLFGEKPGNYLTRSKIKL